MNRYFNNIVSLITGTKARAGDVETKMTSISAGFDTVQTEIDAKAPINNAALTGTPTAPTAAAGTANNQIATTQFVVSAALSSSLPGQAGNAGKFISTDGTNAFWQTISLTWAAITGKPTTLTGYGISPGPARTELGSTAVGDAVFTAASASAARSTLGATSTGSNVFTAADAAAARAAIGAAEIGTNSTITALTGLVGSGLLPTGSVVYHAASTAPTGYLKANGALVSRTTYAALFAAIGTTFGVGDGSTTFALPDLRAEFVRGWDDARGIDSGRSFGSSQTDAFQGHQHTAQTFASANVRAGSNGDTPYTPTTANTTAVVTDGVNGTPRVGSETRPRNVALLACIKF